MFHNRSFLLCVVVQKALELGLKSFQVKLKGTGPGRKVCKYSTIIFSVSFCIFHALFSVQPSLKGLEMGGINIITIQDVTPVPHNGCRPRKARRL